jgi:hypothetical protein
MIINTPNALANRMVNVTIPINLFNETKKTITRKLYKTIVCGIPCFYINYKGMELFVEHVRKDNFILR